MLFQKLFHKKKNLFGEHIEANCGYCSHNSGDEEEPACSLKLEPGKDGSCCGFGYDPLKRTPHALPPLEEHDEDEFRL
ncbi:MAG TPA: hypothetical protein DC013_06755 [Ruminococcaceae bacterium]|nr:hypothetical protein [Oscillospiraceae bacterium]